MAIGNRFSRRAPVTLADLATQYLAQDLPDISGIFSLPQASSVTTPVVEEESVATPQGLTSLYPQNQGGDNRNLGIGNVLGFQKAIDKRQKELNTPNKIKDFIYGIAPQLEPQSIESIMSGGAKRSFGLPFGLTGILSNYLPDSYYDLPYGDQAFIASQQGYFDEGGIGNKDPYGYNVRSLFGNYSNLVDKRVKIADDFFNKKGYYRDIDKFYLGQKQKKDKSIQDAFDKQIIKQQQVDTGDIPTGAPSVNIFDEVALTGGNNNGGNNGGNTGGGNRGGGTFGDSVNDAGSFSDYS